MAHGKIGLSRMRRPDVDFDFYVVKEDGVIAGFVWQQQYHHIKRWCGSNTGTDAYYTFREAIKAVIDADHAQHPQVQPLAPRIDKRSSSSPEATV